MFVYACVRNWRYFSKWTWHSRKTCIFVKIRHVRGHLHPNGAFAQSSRRSYDLHVTSEGPDKVLGMLPTQNWSRKEFAEGRCNARFLFGAIWDTNRKRDGERVKVLSAWNTIEKSAKTASEFRERTNRELTSKARHLTARGGSGKQPATNNPRIVLLLVKWRPGRRPPSRVGSFGSLGRAWCAPKTELPGDVYSTGRLFQLIPRTFHWMGAKPRRVVR